MIDHDVWREVPSYKEKYFKIMARVLLSTFQTIAVIGCHTHSAKLDGRNISTAFDSGTDKHPVIHFKAGLAIYTVLDCKHASNRTSISSDGNKAVSVPESIDFGTKLLLKINPHKDE
jgi:hypothetical protein